MRVPALAFFFFAACFAQSAHGAQLSLAAKLTARGADLPQGVIWRIFSTARDVNGDMQKIAEARGGATRFNLDAGAYLVHASYGLVSEIRQINLKEGNRRETFVFNAGGVKLDATAGGRKIAAEDLLFDIFSAEGDEPENRELIAENIGANRIVRLKEGTYHIVSEYGAINANVRADLEVKEGQVTSATLQHRAAKISLKLVSRQGGDPIANTAWTILTAQGEKVFESTVAAPAIVLAEGQYEASVRNGDKTYIHDFDIKSGRNQNLEILIEN